MPEIPLLPKYADLKANGIVGSRPGLNQMQTEQGFPRPHWVPGLGKVWTRQEIIRWFRERGIELQPDTETLTITSGMPTTASDRQSKVRVI